MSYIEEVARDALKESGSDITKARRTLVVVAGILALIHLLTVYPYLQASREIAGVERDMADNAALLARIEPEIARLEEAGERASSQLTALLDDVTAEMIARFADLRDLVDRASRGETIVPAVPLPEATFNLPVQQMLLPQSESPPFPQVQQIGPQFPGQFPAPGTLPGLPAPPVLSASPDLTSILEAIAAQEQGAYDRLTDFARSDIVAAAYGRAQREWSEFIRPGYIEVLSTTEEKTRQIANGAPASAEDIASALAAAAEDMARERATVAAIEISHDANVDAALGTDWWRTVQGKGAFADAVSESIDRQMREIAAAAGAPSSLIRDALALQEQLRDKLQSRQDELEKQFADQRQQLAALSGTSGVIPVDLATFIGIFPLVLGLGLGSMLLRAGEARRQAALAAEDLARSTSHDAETRTWLSRRALGGTLVGALVLTGALAAVAIAWIGLAASQVANSPVDPPISGWTSGAVAILLMLAAALWDGTSIFRLAAGSKR